MPFGSRAAVFSDYSAGASQSVHLQNRPYISGGKENLQYAKNTCQENTLNEYNAALRRR